MYKFNLKSQKNGSIPTANDVSIQGNEDYFFILDSSRTVFGLFVPEKSQILALEVEKKEVSGCFGCSKRTETWLSLTKRIQLDTENAGDKNSEFIPQHFHYLEEFKQLLLMGTRGRLASFEINLEQGLGSVNNINRTLEIDMRKLSADFSIQNVLISPHKRKPHSQTDVLAVVSNWKLTQGDLPEEEREYFFPWVYHWIFDSSGSFEFMSKVMLDHFNASGKITSSCIFDYKVVTPSAEDTVKTVFLYEGLANEENSVSRFWALYNDSARDKYKLCDSPYENITGNSEICHCMDFKPDPFGFGDIYAVKRQEFVCIRIYTEGEERNLDIT